MAELKHILDGYKVLDFTQVLAGPTVTRLMAEMGAEILKVELAPQRRTLTWPALSEKRPQRLLHSAEPGQEEPVY